MGRRARKSTVLGTLRDGERRSGLKWLGARLAERAFNRRLGLPSVASPEEFGAKSG